MYTDKQPCSFISVAGHRFLTGFGSGGCPCAIIVVAVVRKGWLTACCNGGPQMASATIANAICKGCKCHLHILQMAFATLADGICDGRRWHLRTTITARGQPPFSNNGNHHNSTQATTSSEDCQNLCPALAYKTERLLICICRNKYVPLQNQKCNDMRSKTKYFRFANFCLCVLIALLFESCGYCSYLYELKSEPFNNYGYSSAYGEDTRFLLS